MKKEIFIWCSSISEENGEGRLARLFLKKLKSFTSARYKFVFLNKKKKIMVYIIDISNLFLVSCRCGSILS